MAFDARAELETVKNLSGVLENSIDSGNLEFCINVVGQAKLLADFEKGFQTGQTRNSIQYYVSDGKNGGFNDGQGKSADYKLSKPEKKSAVFGATTEHAVFPEFGTRFQAAQPYIRPAIALASGANFKDVAEAVRKETDKGVLKAGVIRETFF